MGLSFQEIYGRLKEKFPEGVVSVVEGPGDPYAVVEAGALVEICRHLKETPELQFDYLSCQSGADDLANLWSIYHLYSIPRNHRATLHGNARKKPSGH